MINNQFTTEENYPKPQPKNKLQTKLLTAIATFGGLAVLALLAATVRFWNHGGTLQLIRSRSGDSVAEAFYQEVGGYGYAFGNFSCGLAFCLLTILAIYFSYFLQNRK